MTPIIMGKIVEVIREMLKPNFRALRGTLWAKTTNIKCKLAL